MMNQFLSLRLAVLLLPAVAVADVTEDWSTIPLPQNTPIWNIGQSTADFPDWCIYSHGRWSSQPWHDAWVKTGPVLLPTVPFDPSNFKVACHGVPLPRGCESASIGGGYNGLGSCITSSDNVIDRAGDSFSVRATLRLAGAAGGGMSGFTPAVWTFHDGTTQNDPRGPGGSGPGTPGSGSEIDIEPGTLARYGRNGLLLVPASAASRQAGTRAASENPLESECGAQGDYVKWPGQDNNDGCTGFALCRGFSQRNVKFTVGDSTLVGGYLYTDMVTIAMDLYDGGGLGTIDLADGGVHEYRFDSMIDSAGRGSVTFYIDSERIMAICHDHLVFYNDATSAPDGVVCVRAYPGSTRASMRWDVKTGTSVPIAPEEFVGVDPTGTALAAGLNSAPAQLFIGPWMPTWTGYPCSTEQMKHEVHGAAYNSTPAGDLDGDGMIGPEDLSVILGAWGHESIGGYHIADLDRDGRVGPRDLGVLLGEWSVLGL
jgi:hypothetical protein